jgi:hypothetical protein
VLRTAEQTIIGQNVEKQTTKAEAGPKVVQSFRLRWSQTILKLAAATDLG